MFGKASWGYVFTLLGCAVALLIIRAVIGG